MCPFCRHPTHKHESKEVANDNDNDEDMITRDSMNCIMNRVAANDPVLLRRMGRHH